MKNVLITGSEGYIAKNFIHENKKYFNIIGIDRKTGNEVLDFNDFENVDFIIHLAAISGIKNCDIDIEQTILDNVTSTIHLMKNAAQHKIPMIFASSQGAKNPDNLYSITKRICEKEAEEYNNQGAKIICLRFSNVYGGFRYLEDKTSVVANFINAKMNNESIKINGNGEQIRDFIHVNDITKAIFRFIMKIDNINDFDIYDVGTGKGTSINGLCKMIKVDAPIYNNDRSTGVESNIANPGKLIKILGFKPEYEKLQFYIKKFL
jgi:UDP-glucose 4-epimerase